MAQEITNFARFYAALRRLPCTGSREELKESLVRQYTWGRTASLREMRRGEYDACCAAMERLAPPRREEWPGQAARAELRRLRSAVLLRMQQAGVDTTRWDLVDRFTLSPRIAGKPFRRLGPEELQALIPKLEAIKKKKEGRP